MILDCFYKLMRIIGQKQSKTDLSNEIIREYIKNSERRKRNDT